MSDRRGRLSELTRHFVEAFNRNDLDEVMSFFSDDVVYDEFNGHRSEGAEEVRAAFEPQFSGAFGVMQFIDEDLFVDVDTGKVMTSWRVTFDREGTLSAFRGLDLLHFEGEKIVRKLTYAKAPAPLFEK